MRKIELASWARADIFYYFSRMEFPYFALTVEVEVGACLEYMKAQNIPSYLGMIFLVSKALNAVEELRVRVVGDEVLLFDVVHPSFTVQTTDGKLNFCRGRHVDEIMRFLEINTPIKEDAQRGVKQGGLDPDNADLIYISCLPWLHFTSLINPVPLKPADSFPRIVWGRFMNRGHGHAMSLNVQIHHGLADGLHVSDFISKLQAFCSVPESGFSPEPSAD
ncbi:CatA-like O-acetyltransferase [Desulfonatronum thiodismutans]|uniref:CatA-like O-acetyltransferase n=1 Tax=Desulfonatronum thiodismutans TaxID=159290 RepID=UPI0004ABE470|nr:CatA-like O-acetyltransferase [Desulfonatronum thiodismutans]